MNDFEEFMILSYVDESSNDEYDDSCDKFEEFIIESYLEEEE
jgi:hypothetical protein